MFRTLISLIRNKSGVTALEYGVIAAVIIVALTGVMTSVGTNLTATFTTVANAL